MASDGRGERPGRAILVVDADAALRRTLEDVLDREGHRVYSAASGAAAQEVLKQADIHIMLVDPELPDMRGEDLIRSVRTFDPFLQIIVQVKRPTGKPARRMMAELDIQGYHEKTDGVEKLLVWIDAALKAQELVRGLRRSEQLQREIVANVSHEFRTPLNIIYGYTDLLLEGDLGELPTEAAKAIHRMARATHDLSELISDVLSYARVELDGGGEAMAEPVVTENLVAELERLAGLLIEGKPVDFEVDCKRAPSRFNADLGKLRVVLRNLVANAAKFTDEGYVRLSIEHRDDDCICFVVSDSGPGIAVEDHEAIFEPFRQVNGSMTRRHRGIGLGLALVRKLIALLDGEIYLESALGEGARFIVRVPAQDLSRLAAAAASAV